MTRFWLILLILLCSCSRSETPPIAKLNRPDPMTPEATPAFLNTLSPQELEEGALLLFDGESTFGWSIDGDAKVENGVLTIGGTRAVTAKTTIRFARSHLRASVGLTRPPEDDIYLNEGAVRGFLQKDAPFEPGKFYSWSWSQEGPEGVMAGGGNVFESFSTSAPVSLKLPVGTQLSLRNVKLALPKGQFKPRPIETWMPVPKTSSVFANAEGWKTLRGGAVYCEDIIPHFVLQLEGKLTGPNADSEIVVRTRADKINTGLAFTLKAAEDGKLDVGSLMGKQKAHKTLARLGETFYLSLVVCENDFAAWVNGIQVMEWSAGAVAKDQEYSRAPVILRVLSPETELAIRNVRYAKLIGEWTSKKKNGNDSEGD